MEPAPLGREITRGSTPDLSEAYAIPSVNSIRYRQTVNTPISSIVFLFVHIAGVRKIKRPIQMVILGALSVISV
jgi:hypothetical protein